MSDPTLTGQDEARRALADEIERLAKAPSLLIGDEFREALLRLGRAVYPSSGKIVAALRTPSQDRGAEEMRALLTSDFRQGRKVPRNVYHGVEPLFMAATDELAGELVQVLNAGAAAIRALPVPADLNEGGGK